MYCVGNHGHKSTCIFYSCGGGGGSPWYYYVMSLEMNRILADLHVCNILKPINITSGIFNTLRWTTLSIFCTYFHFCQTYNIWGHWPHVTPLGRGSSGEEVVAMVFVHHVASGPHGALHGTGLTGGIRARLHGHRTLGSHRVLLIHSVLLWDQNQSFTNEHTS